MLPKVGGKIFKVEGLCGASLEWCGGRVFPDLDVTAFFLESHLVTFVLGPWRRLVWPTSELICHPGSLIDPEPDSPGRVSCSGQVHVH